MGVRAVLITGASSGIGQATALHLAKLGFLVFAGVRRADAVEQLQQQASSGLIPVMLDVEDEASIAQAVQTVTDRVGARGLWALINNAGLATAGPLEFLPLDLLKKQLDVNVIAQVAVTQRFLPLLRLAKGRVINMGSVAGKTTLPYIGPYNASKHALEAITDVLRMELRPWGIAVSIVEPGVIRTPIWQKSVSAFDEMMQDFPQEAHHYYGKQLSIVRRYVQKAERRGSDVQKVIRALEHALTSSRPKTRYVVGLDARLRIMLQALPDRFLDWVIAKVLAHSSKSEP